jgi:geranylgeranyl pyrophosphate synthase
VLLLWERVDPLERGRLQEMVRAWQVQSSKRMSQLLAQHDTLAASQEIVSQYLAEARQALPSMPVKEGRAGLLGLTDYLARRTDALGTACSL